MTTCTSAKSGLWSAADTWDNGVPVANDTIIIAAGHTVEYDMTFATGTYAVVTVNGTLKFTRTAGTYRFATAVGDTWVGTGTVDIGTVASPIPVGTNHNIYPGKRLASTLTISVCGTAPTYKFVRLVNTETSGATRLEIDTDLTGDIWANGNSVRICNINNKSNYEDRVIADITSTYIDITVGLSAEKLAGSYIVLISGNVFLSSSPYGTFNGQTGGLYSNFVVASGLIEGLFMGCTGLVATNITHLGHSLMTNCKSMTISDSVSCGGGSSNADYNNKYNTGCVFSHFYMLGHAYRCFDGNHGLYFHNSIFAGNAIVFQYCWNIVLDDTCKFIGNTTVADCSTLTAFSTELITGTNELTNYSSFPSTSFYSEFIDFDSVDGAYKAWSQGGTVTSQVSVMPTGYDIAYILALESATKYCFQKKSFNVAAGETVNIEVQLRKTASMAYLPRVYLMASIGNPLAGATPVDTFTMTDSTNTWETDTFTIANSTDYDQDYTLWFVAKNASGNAYSAYNITTQGSTGGGGAVSIQPIQSAVRL